LTELGTDKAFKEYDENFFAIFSLECSDASHTILSFPDGMVDRIGSHLA